MLNENYYKVGGSLEYQHPTYVVRQADFDLYDGLKNGEFCYVLNSRQMGKSSLRVQMMKKLKEQGVKCASIDMTRIGSHVTPQEWYAGVVSELLRGFSLSKKVDFSTWWRQRELLPPLQRLRELIEDVLLAEFTENLVIFIDEIDSIIKIKFKEDFFAFIRACYNQRVDNPEYNRLTFCLLGVATPSDLIEDKNISTPFNIGRAIELTGFGWDEVQPLVQGLEGRVSRPEVVLREVLEWTGGQPFLTQKLCKLILTSGHSIAEGREAEGVEELVRSRIIENWETQDEPEHLRTVRDRLLWSDRKEQLLRLYQQILQTSLTPPSQGGDWGVKAKDKPEHMELRLSGLVVKRQGNLRVYNRIYASVFDQSWVENALAEAGLEPDVAATQAPSQAEIQALKQAAVDSLQEFEFQQIEALISAMQAGQALKALVGDDCLLQDYPTASPMLALQTILDNIRERNKFKAHQRGVNSVSFSPDGRRIATAGWDGTLRIWNLSDQQIIEWNSHRCSVWSMSFSPDGQLIATSGLDGTAALWDLSGQELGHWNAHQGTVRRVTFSPDGQMIATVGEDEVRLWDLSGQQLSQWNANQDKIVHVSFSPDGQRITTVGEDGTLRFWDLSGQQIDQWKAYGNWVMDVSFSPDGKQIATVSKSGKAKLWNLSGQQLAQFNHYPPLVRKVTFSPDGQRIATAGWDGTTQLWNLLGQQLAQLKGHKGTLRSMSFSPDGQFIATAGADGTARLWDLSERQLAQWNTHQGTVYGVSFTPRQKHILTAGADGTIRLWDLSGQQLIQLDDPQSWVRSASFSPGMDYLVATGADGKVRLWRVTSQLPNPDLHPKIPYSGQKKPSWEIKNLNGLDYQVNFWYEFQHSTWVNSVSCSPGWQSIYTKRIATAGADGTVYIWDLTGHVLAQWNTPHSEVNSVSYHPDWQRIGTVGKDSTLCLWDLSGHHLAQWNTHQGEATSLSFSPDGQIIATAGKDGTVKLWNLSGQQLAEFKGHQGCVRSVSFCDSGKRIATTGDDGTVRLWRVEELDELLSRGCDWLKDYFVTHPEALEKLEVCQNRFKSIEADRNLARTGDIEGALGKAIPKGIAQFQKTPELSPALDSSSTAEVREFVAKTLVAVLGEMLTRQGDIEKAVAAYAEAQKLDPTMEIPAFVGNNLCWWGSLWGHATDVMEACETAVALEPENRKFRDSRGLARALTGNIAGAIEDFQAFVDWTDDEERRLKRQHWIDALRAGENPFTEEEIESLFDEQIVAAPKALEELEVRQNQISSIEAVRNLAEVGDVEGGALSEAILLAKRDAQASKGIASASSAQAICDRLSSERSIDYTRLRDLLAAGRWKEADQETTAIMLKIAGREAEGWLREEDIEKFPCTDLLTIDQLWVKYSKGHFGFSVQRDIWQSVGGTKNAPYRIFCSFGERVGWLNMAHYWLRYSELAFNAIAPVGYLPGGLLDWLWLSFKDRERDGSVWWNIISSITSRLSQSAPAPITIAHQRLMATPSNESREGFLGEFLVYNKLIKIYQGDITNLVTDVIVSSDDNYLTMGGGVSHRIRQIGGEDIYREVRNLIPLSLGEVAVTTAGNLRARKIFHSVVLDFDESEGLSDKVIQRLVHTCMKKANRYRFKSIAFPLLGTGAGGFPAKAVWEIMLGQIIRDLSDKNQNIIEVIICLYATEIVEELKIRNFLDAIEKFGWKSLL